MQRPAETYNVLKSSGLNSLWRFSFDNVLQDVPMTMLLVFCTVAHERHGLRHRQTLKESESELLAVVFDGPILRIHPSR